MSEETSYQKDLDYKVEIADGIIFQIKNTECRLMFYQEELNPSESGDKLETEKRNVKLKCEIRMSDLVLSNMLSIYNIYKNYSRYGIDMITKSMADPTVVNKWSNFNDKLGDLVMDTHELFPYNRFKDMTDLSEDLWLRVQYAINKKSNIDNNNEQGIDDVKK